MANIKKVYNIAYLLCNYMPKVSKTMFRASIEVRDYSECNETVLNPENADKYVLSLGLFDKPSKAEKIRKLLSVNNPKYTFLLTLIEETEYDQTTSL